MGVRGRRTGIEAVIANVGWKKDSVRSLYFRTRFPDAADAHRRAWLDWRMSGPTWSDAPFVLDVNEVSDRFTLPLSQLGPEQGRIVEDLTQGEAQLLVINARGKTKTFPIPDPKKGPPPPDPEHLWASLPLE
jgi:hypothetical protein